MWSMSFVMCLIYDSLLRSSIVGNSSSKILEMLNVCSEYMGIYYYNVYYSFTKILRSHIIQNCGWRRESSSKGKIINPPVRCSMKNNIKALTQLCTYLWYKNFKFCSHVHIIRLHTFVNLSLLSSIIIKQYYDSFVDHNHRT